MQVRLAGLQVDCICHAKTQSRLGKESGCWPLQRGMLSFLLLQPPVWMDDADLRKAIRNAWPQLVDFLSHHPEWVLSKAKQLLLHVDLSVVEGMSDPKEKVSLVLDMFLRTADAEAPIFKEFMQSVCMECNLPMELEIVFMSVSGEGHVTQGQEDSKEASDSSPSTSTRLERRRPWSSPSINNNGKQSKQQRLDSAERYRQLITTSMVHRYGSNRSAEATEVKAQPSAFSQAFVNLVIHQSKAGRMRGRGEKGREGPIALLDPDEHSSATTRLSELFESVHAGTPKAILLLGKPGMGKTRLMHRICQQWAEGGLPQFQLIFFFEFRQLNLINRKLTLQELLFDFFLKPEDCPDAVFEHILEDAWHTLVIFDGLDEFVENVSLPGSPHTSFPDPLNPLSISELFASLCHGKLLSGCTMLVTTRPKILPESLLKTDTLLAEIWGFDREKVEEYAGYFFHQDSLKEQAMAHLKSNGKLLSMCYIPALCNIVCICLEYLLHHNVGSVQLPQTMTQLYIKMLLTFIGKDQKLSALSEEVNLSQHQATLVGLCELAFKGLEGKKMLFYANEVAEDVKDFACLCGLLLAFEVKTSNRHTQAGYTFVHFSLQEFFAALFLLTSKTIDSNFLKQKFFLRSKWTLKKEAGMPFTENCHVFLSGLSSQGCRRFLSSLARQNEAWIQERQAVVVQMLKRLASAHLTGPKIAELCHCVHETQDVELARHVGKQLNFKYQFRNFRLMPLDMMVMAFVINCNSPNLVSLDFVGCPMELDYLDILGSCENIKSLSFKSRKCGRKFAAVLSKNLPKIKCLTTFQLAGGNITISGLEDLMHAFPNCNQLEDINLQDNRLKGNKMIQVTELFSTVEKLKKIDLSYNEISVSAVLDFFRTAAVSPNVTKLHVRKDTLIITGHSDTGPRLKDEGIKEEENVHKSRTLILRLQDCQLDSQWAEELADILQSCSHLSEIDLSGNHLGDEGCSRLMKMVPRMCISGPLNLSNNQLSLKSIFCLLDAMSICPNIVKLKISVHHQTAILTLVDKDIVGARTAGQLSSDGHQMVSTSRKISLADNNFQGEDLKNVCLALRRCSDVSELDLSNNYLGDLGVLKIAELLPHLKALCSLTLDHNNISLSGVFCLVQFFSNLESMTSMQLCLGSTQKVHLTFGERISPQRHSIISEHQEELLQDHTHHLVYSRCFGLKECTMDPKDIDRLFQILSRCSGLTKIDLSGNSLNDQGVEQLLKFLPCLNSLELLSIRENKFSSNCVRLLANSFNQCKRICKVEVRSSENAFLHFVESQETQEIYLRLIECGIGKDEITGLYPILEECNHLAELDLSGNHLGDEGLRCLLEHLPKTQVPCLMNLCSEAMLLITLVRENNPPKILRLKHCSFKAEHLAQLSTVLGKCITLSNFSSTNNGMMLSNAEDLLRALRKPRGVLRIGIKEPWVKDKSIIVLLKLATEVQGNITALAIRRAQALFMVEQEFPRQVEKVECMVSRFHQCELEAKGVCLLPSLIEKCSQLWALNCSQVQLTDAEAETISNTLLHFPSLKKLELTCCRILPTGMEHLTAALRQCHTIDDIDFSKSELGMDISGLLNALEGKPLLKSINLGSLSINNANILNLTSRLSAMPLLRRLILNNNHLGNEPCSCLALVLKNAIHMEEINLSHNKIDDAGVKEIATAVAEMQSIKQINLSCNSFGSAGGQRFAEALSDSKNLEVLNLSGNNIGNETLEKLAPVLPNMPHLKVLHLASCGIDSEGVACLARVLCQCPQIEEISLSENTIGYKGITALAERLPQSSQLRKIELKVCGISDCSSKSLALGVSHCPLLEEMILSWNKLGDEGAQELAKVLPWMARLKVLDLDKNCITACGARRLAKELAHCRGIQFIRLWHNLIPKDVEQKLKEEEPRLHFSFF
ncbi:protein NLRC5 isoform X2 [Rhineura floridana]|uniref:protein NLRC5 isoform X2 n=1 Tax=Rhineura floridana TaxID=261503 RepID=UPI002AC82DEF|nr:protein NLRC5 isoform X2 [Rhineura floridana]